MALIDLTQQLPPRLARWAKELTCAQMIYGVDPLLLAAVMDRESLGGEALAPKGPAGTGDEGHGRGLCQIDDRAHPTFANSRAPDESPLWAQPAFNILFAALLLRDLIVAFEGHYGPAVAAYNAGPGRVRHALMVAKADFAAKGKLMLSADELLVVDTCTTGGNYATDVLKRRDEFATSPRDMKLYLAKPLEAK